MAPRTDPRAQVLANCRILYGEAPIEIITLFTREFEDPIYQAVAMRYNESDGSWTRVLHKNFNGNSLVDSMYSLLYETEAELARRFSALGIALPLDGGEITVNFSSKKRRDSVVSVSSHGSRSSSKSATSTFEFIPTPRSASPEPDEAVVEAEAEATVDDKAPELNEPDHENEVWIDTDEELLQDGELSEDTSPPAGVDERLDEDLVETVGEVLISEVPIHKKVYEEPAIVTPKPEPAIPEPEPEPLPQLGTLPELKPLPMLETLPAPGPVSKTKALPETEAIRTHDIEHTSTTTPQVNEPQDSFSPTTRTPTQKNVTFSDTVSQKNHIGEFKVRGTSLNETHTRYSGDWLKSRSPTDTKQKSEPSSTNFPIADDDQVKLEPPFVEDNTNWNHWGPSKKCRKGELRAVAEMEVVQEPEPPGSVEDDPWAIWGQPSSKKDKKKKKKAASLESVASSAKPNPVPLNDDFNWGSWGTSASKAKSKIPIRKELAPDQESSSRAEETDFWKPLSTKGKGESPSSIQNEMSQDHGPSAHFYDNDFWNFASDSSKRKLTSNIREETSPEIRSSSRAENGDIWNFASDKGKQTAHQPSDRNKLQSAAYYNIDPEAEVWDAFIKKVKKGKSRAKPQEIAPGQCSATVTEFDWDFTKTAQSSVKLDDAHTKSPSPPLPLNNISIISGLDGARSLTPRPTGPLHPPGSITSHNETQAPKDKEGSQDWLYAFKTPGNKPSNGDTWPSIIPMARSVMQDDDIGDDWGSFVAKKSKKGKKKATAREFDD